MQRLARTITRLLDLAPGRELALDLVTPELSAALESLVASAGASVVAEIAPSGVVELSAPPAPLVPERARELVTRVTPGGLVVVVVHGAAEGGAARGVAGPAGLASILAHELGPVFDLEHVHGEAVTEGEAIIIVLRGLRRPQPTRSRIKELRGLAHNLEASILLGRDGLSAGLVASAKEALARHGLVKAKLTPRARLDKQDAAVELAWAAGGQLIQRVGKTAVLYRPDVPLQPPSAKVPLSGPISNVPAKKPATPKLESVPGRRPRSKPLSERR